MKTGILYNLILEGRSPNGLDVYLTDKEAVDLIFLGINTEIIWKHCGNGPIEFMNGEHSNPYKFLNEMTLEFIEKTYGTSDTTGIWKGIRPYCLDIHKYNSGTLRIVRDKWPELITGTSSHHIFNFRKVIKVCANLIPLNKILSNNRVLYLMSIDTNRIEIIDIEVEDLTRKDGVVFHRIWKEVHHLRDNIVQMLSDISTNHRIPLSVMEILVTKINMDMYIIGSVRADLIHLLKDKTILNGRLMIYNPYIYKECHMYGSKFLITSDIKLSNACAFGHTVILPNGNTCDLELLMGLLNIHDNIVLERLTINKWDYLTFCDIHHKYIRAGIKLVEQADDEFKLYIIHNIPGVEALYGLKRPVDGGIKYREDYSDIVVQTDV